MSPTESIQEAIAAGMLVSRWPDHPGLFGVWYRYCLGRHKPCASYRLLTNDSGALRLVWPKQSAPSRDCLAHAERYLRLTCSGRVAVSDNEIHCAVEPNRAPQILAGMLDLWSLYQEKGQ